ncbi:MAG: hypothetical protein Ct9H90mP2_15780 [Dehalococcoidia bacterium]|nr:MAG: hypothetical protein Ct9H90mP2_15780 [Dehalococcoidia bacterium]
MINKNYLLVYLELAKKTTFTSEAIINFVDGIESLIMQDSNKDFKNFTNWRVNT